MIYITYYESPINKIMLASDGKNLLGLWLDGQKYFGATILKDVIVNDELPIFLATKKWLDEYFKGEKPEISQLPLSPIGNEFRQSVWEILCSIPYGQTITYGEIAIKIAKKYGKKSMSAQAVGGAVGHNPISIIIPCHRVVGKDGNLTGFAGGIESKIFLLEHEKCEMSNLYRPKKGTAL